MNELKLARAVAVSDVGDPVDRLAVLFDIHYDRLYRLARRLTTSADDALDLVQETFLRVARYPRSVPVGLANEEAWLVRILINIRRDEWRKASSRSRFEEAASGESHLRPTNRGLEEAVIARAIVWRALDVLSPRRRAVVVMSELEGLSIPAIASVLGISQITVRWHLSMGKRDLTTALKPYMEDAE